MHKLFLKLGSCSVSCTFGVITKQTWAHCENSASSYLSEGIAQNATFPIVQGFPLYSSYTDMLLNVIFNYCFSSARTLGLRQNMWMLSSHPFTLHTNVIIQSIHSRSFYCTKPHKLEHVDLWRCKICVLFCRINAHKMVANIWETYYIITLNFHLFLHPGTFYEYF